MNITASHIRYIRDCNQTGGQVYELEAYIGQEKVIARTVISRGCTDYHHDLLKQRLTQYILNDIRANLEAAVANPSY